MQEALKVVTPTGKVHKNAMPTKSVLLQVPIMSLVESVTIHQFYLSP